MSRKNEEVQNIEFTYVKINWYFMVKWRLWTFTPVTGVRLPVGTPNKIKGLRKANLIISGRTKSGHKTPSELLSLGVFSSLYPGRFLGSGRPRVFCSASRLFWKKWDAYSRERFKVSMPVISARNAGKNSAA